MEKRQVLKWLRSQPGAVEERPFGPETLVFKVGGKRFGSMHVDGDSVNLKCDPNWARTLRAEQPSIMPGYHMNKQHWNTVRLDGSLADDLLQQLLEHSYTLVADSLPRAQREALRSGSAS